MEHQLVGNYHLEAVNVFLNFHTCLKRLPFCVSGYLRFLRFFSLRIILLNKNILIMLVVYNELDNKSILC